MCSVYGYRNIFTIMDKNIRNNNNNRALFGVDKPNNNNKRNV